MSDLRNIDPESRKIWIGLGLSREEEPATEFWGKSVPEMLPQYIPTTLGKILDDMAAKKIEQLEKHCCRATRLTFSDGIMWATDGLLVFPMSAQYCLECGQKL